MGTGSSYKMVVHPSSRQRQDSGDFDWIAKPPQEGQAHIPPLWEKALVVGEGPILGKGGYGVTYLSKSSLTGEYYAVKVLAKASILRKKSIPVVQAEIDTLARMQHPFIVHLFAVHQDDIRVALVMEYAAGGELLYRIRKRLRLQDAEAKFYAAEIADALQYMHNHAKIIYHDLKPENILLAADGHIKVVDFGLALDAEARQWDECRMGTSMYMAPELAKHRVQGAHAPAVDWWSFGCVVYEMLSGSLPFGDSAELTKYEIYTNITEKSLRFGKGFGSTSRGLLKRLLDKNPETRLGWEGVQGHKWFRNVDWGALRKRRIFPPWIPPTMKPGCTQCFLQWKPESPAGAASAGVAGAPAAGESTFSDPDCMEYSRIKVPPGYALRPPPPPQPVVTGKSKGGVSKEGSIRNNSKSLQRGMTETMGGRYRNSATRGSTTSLDHSAVTANKRASKEGEGGGGGGDGGRPRCREAANVGSPGGGNAKRRFKSVAVRVAAGNCSTADRYSEARAPPVVGAGGSPRPMQHDPASRHHGHTISPGGPGGGGRASRSSPSSVQRSSTSKSKQPPRAIGYR